MDRNGAIVGTVLGFVFGYLSLYVLPMWNFPLYVALRWNQKTYYSIIYDLLVLPFVFVFFYVSWRADAQRRRIDEYVSANNRD